MMPDRHGGPAEPAASYMDTYAGAVMGNPKAKPGKRITDSGGRDVTSLPDEDFAGPGHTFPIVTEDDVADAASLAHHADNPAQVRSNIKRIARRKFGKHFPLPPTVDAAKAATMAAEPAPAGPLTRALAEHRAASMKLQAWAATYQPAPVTAGHQAEPAVNHPAPRGPLAAGHPVRIHPAGGDPWDPGRLDVHLDQQGPLPPVPAATVTTVCGSPPASSYHDHPGSATVMQIPAGPRSAPALYGQLGDRAPAGAGGLNRPAPHTAPTGTGQTFRTDARRPSSPPSLGSAYLNGRTTPYQPRPNSRPPGYQFSCTSPGAQQ